MEAFLQKNITDAEFPFNLYINDGNYCMRHHWHEEIEIIYVIEGKLRVGVNEEVYELFSRDILIIRSGDIHYFISPADFSKRAIILFKHSLFDSFYSDINEKKLSKELIAHSQVISHEMGIDFHGEIEKHIQKLIEEQNTKTKGYKLALKARIFDLAVMVLRNMNVEESSDNKMNSHRKKLQKLEKIFQFVEVNYSREIYLSEVADSVGFSIYHFSRFFKENAGMTFNEYLNNYRVTIAEWLLVNEEYSITDVAYKSGFGLVNSFNKAFKTIKQCSPTEYQKWNRLDGIRKI